VNNTQSSRQRYFLAQRTQRKEATRKAPAAPPQTHIAYSDLRKLLGITAADMATHLGVSKAYLSMIETGKRPVSTDMELRIGQLFTRYMQIHMSPRKAGV
jgi:plasmid maintenance system antidote protein VapI